MNDLHGGNVHALNRQLGTDAPPVLDLSTNTFADCADLAGAIIAATPHIFLRYPDPDSVALREAVAAHEHVSSTQVLPGNGAAELIWLCLTAVRPRQVLMIGPMFSEYVRVCERLGIAYAVHTPPAAQGFALGQADLDAVRQTSADMILVCQPNNPAGVAYTNLPELGAACGTRTVLVDLSYREFLYGTEEAEPSMWQHLAAECAGSVIGLHSLTKFFCCPGVRLGYALAPAAIITAMRGFQPPWMVGESAAQVGVSMLEHIASFRARLPHLRAAQANMLERLRHAELFDPQGVYPGPSFITARLRGGMRADAVCADFSRRGVLIRNCDTIPGMPAGYVRMQVRDDITLAPLFEGMRALSGNTEITGFLL